MTELETYNHKECTEDMERILKSDSESSYIADQLGQAFGLVMTVPADFLGKLRDRIGQIDLKKIGKAEGFNDKEIQEAIDGNARLQKHLDRLIQVKNQYLDAEANKWFLEDRPEQAFNCTSPVASA